MKLLLNRAQLIAKLDITSPTLFKWMKEGSIPFFKIGPAVRYDLDKVLEVLESKKRRSR